MRDYLFKFNLRLFQRTTLGRAKYSDQLRLGQWFEMFTQDSCAEEAQRLLLLLRQSSVLTSGTV